MIDLYMFDYFGKRDNGLATYVSELSVNLSRYSKIRVNLVWLRSKTSVLIEKAIDQNILNFYVPYDIGSPNQPVNNDEELIKLIKNSFAKRSGIILHFNWINHLMFAQRFKQQAPCIRIVLTKHCIPWRDLVTDNYKIFNSVNRKLLGKDLSPYLPIILAAEKIAYISVDYIICVTFFAKNALQRVFQVTEKNISVIHNGLNVDLFVKDKRRLLREKFGFSQNEKIILYAGAINERKGVYDLLTAFRNILKKKSSLRLIICGSGDYSKVFENTYNLWSKITITGPLDRETLKNFYYIADIGIVPSYVEQCSYTTIEMMYFGLPIIVADVDGLAEIVPDNCGLKVPLMLGKTKAYIHQQKLADRILYFLDNHQIANDYAASARQYAIKNFSAKRMAAETIEVYEKLVAENENEKTIPDFGTDAPLVSIILPCYNAEKYLKDCLNSILKQTYPCFELLIINDGSTDTTINIIKSYKDNRIRLVNNDTNCGIVYCLNQGIKQAKGKYLARIDADDIMHEERLQKQVRYLEDRRNNDVAIVGSSHFVIDDTGRMIGLKQYPVSDAEIKTFMLFQNPFSHPSVMIRATALKKMKYNSKYKHAEDYNLWFNLSGKYKFANLLEFLTYYRVHPANTSLENAKEQQRNAAALISDELDKLGVEYSPNELALHIAISAGYGARFFNTRKKINELYGWIDKILSILKNKNGFSS
ncbi:MAG: glycosyltransferase [Chitinophagaceae bacterium]|nr:glycosyltransferase [Chitinophagaceae bacterium]